MIEVRAAGSIAQAAPGDAVRQSQYSRQLRELSEFFGCEVAQWRGKILKLSAKGADGRLAELAREQLRSRDDSTTTNNASALPCHQLATQALLNGVVLEAVMNSWQGW